MIRNPKEWRAAAGLTMASVATSAGIIGRNPSATYSRYERGAQQCPAPVIAAVEKLSDGAVTAASWQAVRMEFLGNEAVA